MAPVLLRRLLLALAPVLLLACTTSPGTRRASTGRSVFTAARARGFRGAMPAFVRPTRMGGPPRGRIGR